MPGTDYKNLQSVASEIRTHDAVVVLGAGVSIPARLPAVGGLDALLWRALDADPEALQALQRQAGLPPSTAKDTVQALRGNPGATWRCVSTHPRARKAFQEAFASLDSGRAGQFSPAHDAVARLLHQRYIEFVVSLNWDTQLEGAWFARYGQAQTIDPLLFKPHGDARDPEEKWVLPGESRVLPAALSERTAQLVRDRPRVLLVVGYSEADEEVVDGLIAPLEDRWRVVRVSRSATGPDALAGSAQDILPALIRAVDPPSEERPWRYVHFQPQHDLGWALSGRGLGPLDVSACPAVPEVAQAQAQLRATGAVTIVGESGSGKSLVAAQAAHDLWRAGEEVVELADAGADGTRLRQSLLALPRPVVAIVDDAQRLDPGTRQALLGCAATGLSVIAAVTDQPAGEDGIRLDAGRATSVLAQHIRRNRAQVLPLVHALDPHLSDSRFEDALEGRLRLAERDLARQRTQRPWQLTWILTGGWRRVSGEIAALRELGHGHDLVLALVAIGQLIRTGDATPIDELQRLAEHRGRDRQWLDEAVSAGRERRLLVRDGQAIRLPHMRFARVVLELELWDRQTRDDVLGAVADAASDPASGIAGLHWLLDDLFFAGPGVAPKRALLSAETAAAVVARAWAAPDSEIGPAARVLEDVGRFQPETVDLDSRAADVGRWISTATPQNTSGLASLINSIINDDRQQLPLICEHIDVDRLLTSFVASTWPEPYFYGELFGRLGFGPEWFRTAVKEGLDRPAVERLFDAWSQAPDAETFDLAEAVMGLAYFDDDLALDICERLAPAIAAAWQQTFAGGYSDLLHLWFVLGFGPAFLRHRQPDRRQRRIARRICEALDPDEVAQQVSRSVPREWQGVGEGLALVEEASPRHVKRILARLDFDALEQSTAPYWTDQVQALTSLLVGLGPDPDYEPAASWVAGHVPQMERLNDLAVVLAPAASARRLRQLDNVADLGAPTHAWQLTELALTRLGEADRELLRMSIAAHKKAFAEGLVSAGHLDEAAGSVQALARLAPSELAAIVAAMDAEKALENWGRVLATGGAKAKRVVATLIGVALASDGSMHETAATLRQRFPAASRRALQAE